MKMYISRDSRGPDYQLGTKPPRLSAGKGYFWAEGKLAVELCSTGFHRACLWELNHGEVVVADVELVLKNVKTVRQEK